MPRPTASLLLISLLALAGPAIAADTVFPPGSRIGLVPPTDMVLTRGLAGFRNPRTGAAILAVEMPPDAYPSLAAGFTDENLKAQGFTLSDRGTVNIGSAPAMLITGEQSEGGRAVPKTVLLAADPSMTALVIGQLPVGASPADLATLQAALKSVSFRPPLRLDEQLDALPFRLGDRAGFRPVRIMAGNSLLMTDGASDVIREASQPVLIVAQSFAPGPPVAGRDAFARQALAASTFVKDTVIERSQPFRQGGTDWHEIVAKGVETGSGTPVIIMQTIRFEADSYLRAVGVAKADQRDAALPRFRRIVDSITER